MNLQVDPQLQKLYDKLPPLSRAGKIGEDGIPIIFTSSSHPFMSKRYHGQLGKDAKYILIADKKEYKENLIEHKQKELPITPSSSQNPQNNSPRLATHFNVWQNPDYKTTFDTLPVHNGSKVAVGLAKKIVEDDNCLKSVVLLGDSEETTPIIYAALNYVSRKNRAGLVSVPIFVSQVKSNMAKLKKSGRRGHPFPDLGALIGCSFIGVTGLENLTSKGTQKIITKNLKPAINHNGTKIVYCFDGTLDTFQEYLNRLSKVTKEGKEEAEQVYSLIKNLNTVEISPPSENRAEFIQSLLKYQAKQTDLKITSLEEISKLLDKTVPENCPSSALRGNIAFLIAKNSLEGNKTLEYSFATQEIPYFAKQRQTDINNSNTLLPGKIIEFIANYTDVSEKKMRGKKKFKEYVISRHLAMAIISDQTGISLKDIGKEFDATHGTVLNGIRNVEKSKSLTQKKAKLEKLLKGKKII